MYIVRSDWRDKPTFQTYDGWVGPDEKGVLDLSNVMRYTEHEARTIVLPEGQRFVWFGCYKELDT